MADDLQLTAFEQEMIRRFRALPFEARQHISRAILRLQREHRAMPATEQKGAAHPSGPLWNMAPDEIAEVRRALAKMEEDPPEETD